MPFVHHFRYFFDSLNPAILIYSTASAVVLLRRFFPKKRSFHERLKLSLFLLTAVIVVRASFFHYIALVPNLLILKGDWFEGAFFGAIERNSIPILVSLLVIIAAVAKDYGKLSFSFCVRFIMHIGSAVGVLFARDAMSVLLYLEMVVIISAAITIGDRNVSRKDAISYSALHVLSGVLMLIGMLTNASSISSAGFDFAFDARVISLVCTALSVAISVGVPPFSFLFVDVYGATDSRNAVTLASFVSKLTIYTYIPIVTGMMRDVFVIFGFLLLPYIFVRLVLQKSLKKIVLLSLLAHIASTLLFVSAVTENTYGLLNLYIGVGMMVAFFAVYAIRAVERYLPDALDDVSLLSVPQLKQSKTFVALIVLLAVLLIGAPGSALYFVESAMVEVSSYRPLVSYFGMFAQMLSVFASMKIIFAFFGVFGKSKKKAVADAVEKISLPYKGEFRFGELSFLFFLAILCFGGVYWLADVLSLLDVYEFKPFGAGVLLHYGSVFCVGVGLALLLKDAINPNRFKFADNYNIMLVLGDFAFGLYQVAMDLYGLIKGIVGVVLGFVVRLFRVGVRKSAIPEFSPVFSSEAAISIAVVMLCLFAMLVV